MQTKQIVAWCAAGLGNKICTLLGALYWSHRLDYDYKIAWLSDPHCHCSYDDLFKKSNNIIEEFNFYDQEPQLIACNKSFPCEETLQTIIKDLKEPSIRLHYLKLFFNIKKNGKIASTEMEANANILTKYNNIIYQNSILPKEITSQHASELLSSIKINSNIYDYVEKFVYKNDINKNVKGIALRKTDVPVKYSHEYYFELIQKNRNTRFYVTSDDNDTKELFNQFSNVTIFKNNSSVVWSSNSIYRDKQSVIDALIDLLILSRTSLIRDIDDIKSTYFLCALLFHANYYSVDTETTLFIEKYKDELLECYLRERG